MPSKPINGARGSSDKKTGTPPARMRDWLIRQINSGIFPGLEWLNEEKNVFKVPWIHAKKRGYNRERDAALFRAWAMHSGKYRDESDPIIWKIHFRCAINGLKDIQEIKDMQTEDCRVYRVHVYPSRKRAGCAKRIPFSSMEPLSYPSPNGRNDKACAADELQNPSPHDTYYTMPQMKPADYSSTSSSTSISSSSRKMSKSLTCQYNYLLFSINSNSRLYMYTKSFSFWERITQ